MSRVREPVLAGNWYERTGEALERSVAEYLESAHRPDAPIPESAEEVRTLVEQGRFPRALIVPHAGHYYSGDCAGAAFRLLHASGYRRVVLLGPSHYVPIHGMALPDADAFRTPLGTVPLDREAIERLLEGPGFEVVPPAHSREHCLEIELPFLQKVLPPGFRLVPLVAGRIGAEEIGWIAAGLEALWDPDTLIVVSSDFTHYGPNFAYLPFTDDVPDRIRELDFGAIECVLRGSSEAFESYREKTEATICGAEPIRVLLRMARGRDLEGRLVDYYRSGDKSGDFLNSVSYAALAFFDPVAPDDSAEPRAVSAKPGPQSAEPQSRSAEPRSLSPEEQRYLLQVARRTLQGVVRGLPPPRVLETGGMPAPGEGALGGPFRGVEASAGPSRGIEGGGASVRGSEGGGGPGEPGSPVDLGEIARRFGADSPLLEKRSAFVTLTGERGSLRGCIGSVTADCPLVENVIENTIASATRDPRFLPVTREDEPHLEIEISVLSPLRRIRSPEEIEIGRDGVVLHKRGRRAVFLPQVAVEQGWDVEETLGHLCAKAGLGRDEWRHDANFQTFQAQILLEGRP